MFGDLTEMINIKMYTYVTLKQARTNVYLQHVTFSMFNSIKIRYIESLEKMCEVPEGPMGIVLAKSIFHRGYRDIH